MSNIDLHSHVIPETVIQAIKREPEKFGTKIVEENGKRYFDNHDLRFEGLLAVLGIDRHDLALSQALYNDLRAPVRVIAGGEAVLPADERLKAIAVAFTWLDYVIQVVVGVLFLLPGERMERLAHASLVVFILFIYFAAPVLGFGWLIAILGIALAHGRFPRLTLGYLCSLIVLISYQIPWSKVAMELGWIEVMQ